jgi:hypothetical protein
MRVGLRIELFCSTSITLAIVESQLSVGAAWVQLLKLEFLPTANHRFGDT